MSFAEPQLNAVEEEAQYDKRSLIASGLALCAMILFLVLLPGTWIGTPFQAFLYGAGACLILWTAAFLLTLRHGSNWMALGAFIALLLVGLGGTSFKYVRDTAGAGYDSNRARHRLMETLYSRPGAYKVVADVGEPTMAVTGRYLNAVLKDRNAYHKLWDATGMATAIETAPISQSDPAIRNCDRFAALSKLAKEITPNAAQHAKAASTAIAKSDLNRTSRDQMIAEFDVVQKVYLPMQNRLWPLRAELAEKIQTRCQILARGRWINQGNLNFTDTGDFNAFRANSKAINALLDEEVDIQNKALRQTVDVLNNM